MAKVKLRDLLNEVFQDAPKVNKHKVIEGVSNYSNLGKKLYSENSLLEISKSLINIAESAHSHILSETDDWFDKVTVNKNMKSLKNMVGEFKKTAGEANSVNQRLTALYEDMGHILNRYYDINEDIVTEDSGDMDNDGIDEPDDEEYLDNKDKAIKKAMKKENTTKKLSDIKSNVVNVGVVGTSLKK